MFDLFLAGSRVVCAEQPSFDFMLQQDSDHFLCACRSYDEGVSQSCSQLLFADMCLCSLVLCIITVPRGLSVAEKCMLAG